MNSEVRALKLVRCIIDSANIPNNVSENLDSGEQNAM